MADSPRLPRIVTIRSGDAAMELDLAIDADLAWFQGHFPEVPVLAGVVQLEWALDFARTYLGIATIAARQFQIKFKAVISPGDMVTLALRHHAAKGKLGFEYRRDQHICSVGSVVVS